VKTNITNKLHRADKETIFTPVIQEIYTDKINVNITIKDCKNLRV
jgi:hypothetical protein